MSTEIKALQALRLKGRPTLADAAASSGVEPDALEPLLAELADAGYCERAKERYKLTGAGRERLELLVAQEAAQLDQAALAEVFGEFNTYNVIFKQLMADWQLKGGSTPNDHTDAAYDAAIVTRLERLHADFLPVVTRLARIAPRLDGYPGRFDAAWARVCGGDHTWIARPLVDSYHTVWFELHEEMLGLRGLSRVDEAAAGRAE